MRSDIPHFSPMVLVTQTNPGTVWKGTIEVNKHQEVGIIRGQLGGWPIQGANCEFSKRKDDLEGPLRYLRGNVKEIVVRIVLENGNRSREPRKHPNVSVLQL